MRFNSFNGQKRLGQADKSSASNSGQWFSARESSFVLAQLWLFLGLEPFRVSLYGLRCAQIFRENRFEVKSCAATQNALFDEISFHGLTPARHALLSLIALGSDYESPKYEKKSAEAALMQHVAALDEPYVRFLLNMCINDAALTLGSSPLPRAASPTPPVRRPPFSWARPLT